MSVSQDLQAISGCLLKKFSGDFVILKQIHDKIFHENQLSVFPQKRVNMWKNALSCNVEKFLRNS